MIRSFSFWNSCLLLSFLLASGCGQRFVPTGPASNLDEPDRVLYDRAMTDLLMMSLVCNQTKVFNMVYSDSGSSLTRKGLDKSHHAFTHEEPVNAAKGYQIHSFDFVSDAMSRDLYQRGFKFVGPTICYAFMQATGMVNDHLVDCFRHQTLL